MQTRRFGDLQLCHLLALIDERNVLVKKMLRVRHRAFGKQCAIERKRERERERERSKSEADFLNS